MSDLDQLEDMAARFDELAHVHARAAAPALDELLHVARAEWGAGETPGGAAMVPLHAGGGAPLTALTSQITGGASGSRLTVRTPEPLKFHMAGFAHHTGELGDRLREAQAMKRNAKSVANGERVKRANKLVRELKKVIRATSPRVAARPTLPGRKSMPASWGRAIQKAIDATALKILVGDT